MRMLASQPYVYFYVLEYFQENVHKDISNLSLRFRIILRVCSYGYKQSIITFILMF